MPTAQHHSLSAEEFRLGVLMRLSMRIPEASALLTCPNPKCPAAVDGEGLHLLTCGIGPGRVRLHDRMVRSWNSLILSTGLRSQVEPRGLYTDQRRPDIVVPDFEAGRDLHLDFSATHPCLPINLASASITPGAAAAKREAVKRNTYSDCTGTFKPLVVEHHSRWGSAAIHLLESLAKQAAVSFPGVTRGSFRNFWLKKLGCELQKGIAHSITNNAVGWHRNDDSQELRIAIACHK